MAEKQFTGSIALSKLKHVILEKKGKSGMIKGIFIPLEANRLVEGKDNAVYMNLRGTLRDEQDSYKNNGFLAYSPDFGKKWSEMTEAEKEESKEMSPILGNLKTWENSGGGNDSSGAASTDVLDEDDDLPF
jgi:hypothetical protein